MISDTEAPSDGVSLYFRRLGTPIVAIATAKGGPVGVIRVSGKNLSFLLPLVGILPAPGTFRYTPLKVKGPAIDSLIIDRALVLSFKSPHSFTGEDVLELQCHGVASVLESILEECVRLGASSALPGEFSFRAVLNEKMSLEEAEFLQMAFSTEGLGAFWAAKLLGVRPSGGSDIARILEHSMAALSEARGRVEAAIDFPEAEAEQSAEIISGQRRVEDAQRALSSLLGAYQNFSSAASEAKIVLVGEPNVGKSTLFNLLIGGRRALVSPIAGTTRDSLDARIRLRTGQWVRLIDTAGIHEAATEKYDSSLEKAGMEMGLEIAEQASLLIWVRNKQFAHAENKSLRRLLNLGVPTIEIFSHGLDAAAGEFDFTTQQNSIADWLLREIEDRLRTALVVGSHVEVLVSTRQALCIESSLEELKLALDAIEGGRPLELSCVNIRNAEELLKKAVGRNLENDYMDKLFGQFCLGK